MLVILYSRHHNHTSEPATSKIHTVLLLFILRRHGKNNCVFAFCREFKCGSRTFAQSLVVMNSHNILL